MRTSTPSLTPLEDMVRAAQAAHTAPTAPMEARISRVVNLFAVETARMMDEGCTASDIATFGSSVVASVLGSTTQNLVANGHMRDEERALRMLVQHALDTLRANTPYRHDVVENNEPQAGRA
jgi:hypothetical protein